MMLQILALLGCVALVLCGRSTHPQLDDDAFFGVTTTDNPSYTYIDYGQCLQLCDLPCTRTVVNFDTKKYDMYNCVRLKVIKTSFMDNLKGGTFQNTIIGIVIVTVSSMVLIVCVYYCCCSSKNDDKYIGGRDEFRELGPHEERKALNKGSSVIEV